MLNANLADPKPLDVYNLSLGEQGLWSMLVLRGSATTGSFDATDMLYKWLR